MSTDDATPTERLFLADAMALAYRAHFAFISRPLVNSKGLDTSAIYGFTLSLLKILEDDPEHIAVVFDPIDGTAYRGDLFEDYKAHRPPMPDPLRQALPYLKAIVKAFDIPVLEVPGVEADDVIGTIARRAEKEGVHVIIISPDKDFRQLLGPLVSMLRPAYRGEEFNLETDETFRKKYGVEPIQFIDILALMGDKSDNVPGIEGIGEKTAIQLIQQYGSVEGLLDHADEITSKRVSKGLEGSHDMARMSKRLVTILTELDLDIDWHALRRTTPHHNQLDALFAELEFRSMKQRVDRIMQKLDGEAEPVPEPDFSHDPALAFDFGPYEAVTELDIQAVEYTTIMNRSALEELVERLKQQPRIAFDTETTSTDQMWASLVGCSFSWAEEKAAYVPSPLPDGTTEPEVLDLLRPVLEHPEVQKIGHNLKYDRVVMARHGVDVRGPVTDTMVAHYLLEPEAPHGLDSVAMEHLNYRAVPIERLIGTGKNQRSMRDVPIEEVAPYSCEDADVTFRLARELHPKLERDGLAEIAEQVEYPLVPVLADMELLGIQVDPLILNEISKQLTEQLASLEAQVYEAARVEFNIGSPKQLGEVLFTHIGLDPVRKTPGGQPSTNERVLQQLSTEHELPGLVLDWRHLSKLKSTYVDALGELIHPETGRIHTSFNQTVTATGRLSSSKPNLQNIPVRSGIGREIRRAFVPADGFQLVAADYVQIELRILAAMSEDEGLKQAFEQNLDIHNSTAALIYDVPLADVTRDMRRKAKEVNYGIPYGISAYELSQRLRIPMDEAQTLIDQYHRSYPKVNRLLNRLVEQAREKGYAETLLGRRRYIPTIRATNQRERAAAERIAVNMPIQGTQADMIKIAMVNLHRKFETQKLQSRMVLQVHDELLFEVPPGELEGVKSLIVEAMVQALPIGVPVEVDLGVGENWLDAH